EPFGLAVLGLLENGIAQVVQNADQPLAGGLLPAAEVMKLGLAVLALAVQGRRLVERDQARVGAALLGPGEELHGGGRVPLADGGVARAKPMVRFLGRSGAQQAQRQGRQPPTGRRAFSHETSLPISCPFEFAARGNPALPLPRAGVRLAAGFRRRRRSPTAISRAKNTRAAPKNQEACCR